MNTIKRCRNGDSCLHPEGPELPATTEYFVPIKRKIGSGLSAKCRPCFYAANKLSRLKHIERAKAYEKERNRQYYAKNRDKELRRVAERRKNDPQKAKEKDRRAKQRRSSESKARDNARTKTWCQKHPDRLRIYAQRRRAKELAAEGDYTIGDIYLQIKSQKDLCWWCGKALKGKYHIDHRVPLDRGGSNDARNICISCPKCNLSKGRKLPYEWNGRLL